MKYIFVSLFILCSCFCNINAQTEYFYFCGNSDGTVSFDDMVITVIKTDDSIKCYIHGNTDEFDSAREGYLPGFFVLEAKDFMMESNKISFKLNSNGYSFTSSPIDIFINSYNSTYPSGYKAWIQPREYFWKEIEYSGEFTQDYICLNSTNDFGKRYFKRKCTNFISQYKQNLMSEDYVNRNSE